MPIIDKNGKKKYIYSSEPPEKFIYLTQEIKRVNEELMNAQTCSEQEFIFNELMELSKKMQNMGKD